MDSLRTCEVLCSALKSQPCQHHWSLQSRLRSGDRVKTLDWSLVTVTHLITSKRSKKAEATELDHCRKICGVPCRNCPDVSSNKDYKIPTSPLTCPPYQSVEPSSNTAQHNSDDEAMEKPKRAVVQTQIERESSTLPADQVPLQDLSQTGATAVTLVSSPDFSVYDITIGLVPSTYCLSPVVPRRLQVHHKTWRGS